MVLRLGMVLLLAACSASPVPASSPSATISAGPRLDCAAPIETLDVPPAGYVALLDAVALASGALQANDAGEGKLLFAKTGLLVRSGRAAELIVPAARAEVEWGNTGHHGRTSHLIIPSCPKSGAGDWQVYPGGYYVTKPQCLPVEVHAGGRIATVRVQVGTSCPA
ncbi:hypothetical protein Aiant_12190 [Actinoplanes ianthinogenes]|uniref:Lipoprotein n=1 Tax=Actinoplanes ianthinogenes TaxID=122358 RepID=A0ABM7LMX7_9ACTN|nr:hypothetical protein Aiant_12190 [Actinoplanes ianthinogenes]